MLFVLELAGIVLTTAIRIVYVLRRFSVVLFVGANGATSTFTRINLMVPPNENTPSFMSRVFANDALKKGLAGAIAGALVAVVTESLWPSER